MLQTALRQESPASRYVITLARHQDEMREAQQLRYRVFAQEMGARLGDARNALDEDLFDAFCEHLLVRERETGEVVGTYRILSPEAARRAGSYYSEQEFDLTRLHFLRPVMAELGRSCVHREHRSGTVIGLLWLGLTQYLRQHGHRYVIGCASIGMADGGHVAASVYRHLAQAHAGPVEWRVSPRNPLPVDALDNGARPLVPPLIKGYVRLGAYVCGEPAWDPDFNTADLFLLLPMRELNAAYARRLTR